MSETKPVKIVLTEGGGREYEATSVEVQGEDFVIHRPDRPNLIIPREKVAEISTDLEIESD